LSELHKTKGNIVSVGSIAGMIGIAQNAPFSNTKCFMHTFTRVVAIKQASKKVRANCVCPGADDTAWTHHRTSKMLWMMEKQMMTDSEKQKKLKRKA